MSINRATEPTYDVGYGKPPQRTRFQPGQSGNRNGRPKKLPTLPEALAKALNERVVITENGRQKTITKHEAVFKQLVNRSPSGERFC